MNSFIDDEIRMLGETVARFTADRAGAAAPSADALWREFADLGWLALPYSEEAGGLGLGKAGVFTVMHGHGNGLLQSPYLPVSVLSGGVLARCARGAEPLAQMMEGTLRIAPAFVVAGTETQAGTPKLAATSTADGFRLNGADINVLAVDAADAVLAAATIGDGGEIGLFLVPLDTAGITTRPYKMIDGRAAGHVTFADVAVPASARLDDDAGARAILDQVRSEALIAAAAENLGAMQSLYEQTLDYAKLRKQFGRAIGSFQTLQFRLVDMWIKLDEARSLVSAAAEAQDDGELAALATAAWIQALWSGRHIAEEAVQIHGAIAMTEEYSVGNYVKRMLVNELLFGAPERHLARYRSLQAD
ncbi:MAG TPA: acyl-CoA dehydrogenase [Xanthobacteraceae bacterium]|nr:acyl-CoA dehydrogenase [Xanthobacteraceae bacterium]HWW49304.1 acyl-CoA dehydrogenase [Xanthobacteraceae bacterium]